MLANLSYTEFFSKMDDFLYEFDFITDDDEDDNELPSAIASDHSDLPAYITSAKFAWMQIPLSEVHAESASGVLSAMDDDTLLNMAPQLLLHIQRTVASGGLQVISPRSTPLTCAAARTGETRRTADMCIVGSKAASASTWLADDMVPVSMPIVDEPVEGIPRTDSTRVKTMSKPIFRAEGSISNPVVRSLMSAKAVVDLQAREDILGTADTTSSLFAAAWAIPKEEFTDLESASISPTGPLLRYAIRNDDSYPVLNAPINQRRCLSVGMSGAARRTYGVHAAIDWRRLRVLAEAVFYLSCRCENISLTDIALDVPPGELNAPVLRAGVLQMRPMPGSVWTYMPSSFRLESCSTSNKVGLSSVTPRITTSLAEYLSVNAITQLPSAGSVIVNLVRTSRVNTRTRISESVIGAYSSIMSYMHPTVTHGRGASLATRAYLFAVLSGPADRHSIRATWMVQALRVTTHLLGLDASRDRKYVSAVASRISPMVTDMRIKMQSEAVSRNATLSEWWDNLRAELPSYLAQASEGTGSWCNAVAWLMLNPPTPRWDTLLGALTVTSFKSLPAAEMSGMTLPSALQSFDRVFAGANSKAISLATAYSSYYAARADAASIIGQHAYRLGLHRVASMTRLAGKLWMIRAAAVSTLTIHAGVGKRFWSCDRFWLGYTIAPYAAYREFYEALDKSKYVSARIKAAYPPQVAGPVSAVFTAQREAFGIDAPNVPVFRYFSLPSTLGNDIEKSVRQICEDVSATAQHYSTETRTIIDSPTLTTHATATQMDFMAHVQQRMSTFKDVYTAASELDQSIALYIIDTLEADTSQTGMDMMGMNYRDGAELMELFTRYRSEGSATVARESVM